MERVVGRNTVREEAREGGQVVQENFIVCAAEVINSVDFIRPYLGGGPGGL